MAVDETRNLGFVANRGSSTLDLVDLERLTVIGGAPDPVINGSTPEQDLALDLRRQWLYKVGQYPSVAADEVCDNAKNPNSVNLYDYRVGTDGERRLVKEIIDVMPCTGTTVFRGITNFFFRSPTDPAADRLYVAGVPGTEGWRGVSTLSPLPVFLGGNATEDRGQALLVRQLAIHGDGFCGGWDDTAKRCKNPHVARPVLEWEVDLRLAGCGRREPRGPGLFEGFVARHGTEVLAYCWDGRAHDALSVGQQGYLVRIPLAPDPADGILRPRTRGNAQRDPASGQLTNYVYRRVPILPGAVTPILDPASGRVMFVTADRTNGNAVWVFDTATERFVGVITGGYGEQPKGNTAVGFDSARGRVYVLTQAGILIAPIRLDPLPAGLIYPVAVNTERRENFATSNRISVAPDLGRLFVAVNDYNDPPHGLAPDHYEVIEDHIPDPPRVEPVDPDALTSQVKEQEGKTASAASGQAIASGAHVVNTGGVARAAGQNDPLCFYRPPNFDNLGKSDQRDVPNWELAPALVGACLAEVAVSPGHREAAVAATDLEASTGGGATARGSAFAFGSSDTGTDGDIRRLSDCGADTPDQGNQWGRRWPFPEGATLYGPLTPADPVLDRGNKKEAEKQLNAGRDAFWDGSVDSDQFRDGQDDYRDGCNQAQAGMAEGSGQTPTGPVDLRSGTTGADGRGFPVRAAVCGDFGGTPSTQTWPEGFAGAPQAGYPTSSASCDASVPQAQSTASAGALALPSAADPQLSVGRVSSKVTSVRTSQEGEVTMAYASAVGVQVGPLSIAEVRAVAVTKAAGRKGSTSAVLVRQWCGLSVAGHTEQGCVDPTSPEAKAMLEEVSAALLQKVQLSVPEATTQATPKGYQAVVTKSQGQRGADQTVNDDDSHTVSALQVVIYNDGPRGRSRLIVQLAGVHTESRYGIIELPNFSTGPDPTPAPTEEGTPSEPSPGAGPATETTPHGAVPADAFTPETFVEESFGVEEVVRTNASTPAPRFVSVPPGGSTPARIVRVPLRVLSDAINLLVQHPREFALLFVMFSLLASPAYLGLRRRSFARALVAP